MSTYAMMNIWIDGHDMTVIEVDGIATKPFSTSVLQMTSAQRYSVLITALNKTDMNYKIHISMDQSMFGGEYPSVFEPNTAVLLQYNPQSPTFESSVEPDPSSFEETNIAPFIETPPMVPDEIHRLDVICKLHTLVHT